VAYVGIDVAAERLHCVALDEQLRLRDVALCAAEELDALAHAVRNAEIVMVDAPAQLSTAPHAGDDTLGAKFRVARCAEIALGREHRSWVPWVTPEAAPERGWITTGLAVFAALTAAGVPSGEVYPHAGYRALARGRVLPRKTTAAGVRARAALLTEVGVSVDSLTMWSHDGLDALLAAVVAADYGKGRARRVTCGHDDSAIWLPAERAFTPT
jgi:predicted nuclease with RNAse H fold